MPIGLARALLTFNLPDYKPFNCQSCLSFWIAIITASIVEWNFLGLAFVTYLISELIIIYEYK
jgi:hypothetical protein